MYDSLLLSFVFGFYVGRWDAKYGAAVGLKLGKKSREFLIRAGFIKVKP